MRALPTFTLLLLASCTAGSDDGKAPTDVVDTDSVDTDSVDTDAVDTDPIDTVIADDDQDDDGWTRAAGDCDDDAPAINPGAAEVYYDGVDQDCDGASDFDADGDGYDSDQFAGDDCDDADATVSPAALEIWYDGVDQDCDSASDFDADGDGFTSVDHGGSDCDDQSPDVHPDATEICNSGVDDNCDGSADGADAVDAPARYADGDGDGHGRDRLVGYSCDPLPRTAPTNDDCDDEDPATFPGASEVPCDGVANDCDAVTVAVSSGATIDGSMYATVREALLAASVGDTVEVCEGRHLVSDLLVPAGVTMVGPAGRDATILDAQGAGAVLRVLADEPVVVRGLTLTNGSGFHDGVDQRGGGAWVSAGAEVRFEDCALTANRAGDGGGLFIGELGQVRLVRTDVYDNYADFSLAVSAAGGGAWLDYGALLELDDSEITDNDAAACGGVRIGDLATVWSFTTGAVRRNHADFAGGGLCSTNDTLVLGIEITHNAADGAGGGLDGSNLTIDEVLVANNTAGLAGGGLSVRGEVVMEHVVIRDNVADIDAGGIDVRSASSHLRLIECEVTGNEATFFAADGGGVVLAGGTITSTRTDWGAGANDNPPGDLALTTDALVCDYVGVQTFTYQDGDGYCPQ